MGASASCGERIDLDTFKELAGNRFSEEAFHQHMDANGTISRQKLNELDLLADIYIAHDYEVDLLGRKNHERALRLNEELQEMGLITRYSLDSRSNNPHDDMCRVVENASLVIICLTKKYCDKVEFGDQNDFCKFEFEYLTMLKPSANIIVVIMEPRVLKSSSWSENMSLTLFNCELIDCTDDESFSVQIRLLFTTILKHIKPLKGNLPTKKRSIELPNFDFAEGSDCPNIAMHFEDPNLPNAALIHIESNSIPTPFQPVKPQKQSVKPKLTNLEKEPTRNLLDLSVKDVIILFCKLRLPWCEECIIQHSVDGKVLSEAIPEGCLEELGFKLSPARFKGLCGDLHYFLSAGVPTHLLSPAPQVTRTISECLDAFEQASQLSSDIGIVKVAFESVPRVIGKNSLKQRVLGEVDGFLETVVSLMQSHVTNSSLAEFGLVALKELCCFDEDTSATCVENVVNLGRLGAVEVLLTVLTEHRSSSYIVIESCCAINSLILNEDNLLKLLEGNLCSILVEVLNMFRGNQKVAEECCRVIWSLAVLQNGRILLSTAGACEALVRILKEFAHDSTVAQQACGAVFSMVVDLQNVEKMSAVGACEGVMRTLKAHQYHHVISMLCCGTIWYLAMLPANRQRLLESGVAGVLGVVLYNHPADADIALYFCSAVQYLVGNVEGVTTEKLGDEDFCGPVIKTLSIYVERPEHANSASAAIWKLSNSGLNLQRLSELGGVKQIITCLKVHVSHVHIVLNCFGALVNFTAEECCDKEELMLPDTYQAVLSATGKHGRSHAEVAALGCAVLANILQIVDQQDDNIISKTANTVVECLRSHATLHDVAERIIRAIATIVKLSSATMDSVHAAGGLKAILQCAILHVNRVAVIRAVCTALMPFSADSEEKRNTLVALGIKRYLNELFADITLPVEDIVAARALMDSLGEESE